MSVASIVIPFLRDWALTIVIEGCVLWFALAPIHKPAVRLLAAVWLSTCTLPLVHFVFPLLEVVGWPRAAWVALAELFAPVAECVLLGLLISTAERAGQCISRRDCGAIVAANLASFGVGELLLFTGYR